MKQNISIILSICMGDVTNRPSSRCAKIGEDKVTIYRKGRPHDEQLVTSWCQKTGVLGQRLHHSYTYVKEIDEGKLDIKVGMGSHLECSEADSSG